MDVNERITELMKARGWSEYRLAKESGLSNSTIANIFRRNTIPSIPTLELICDSLGITLSQFFATNDLIELDAAQQATFYKWSLLTNRQRTVVSMLIDTYVEPDNGASESQHGA